MNTDPPRPALSSEVLSAFFDGELDEASARQVESRLATGPALRRRLASFRRLAGVLRVECPPDPGFLVRHRRRREAASFLPRWTWPQLGARLAWATAVCLLAAGVSLWRAGLPEIAAPAGTRGLLALEEDLLAVPDDVAGPAATDASRRSALADLGARSTPAEPEPVLQIALGSVLPLPLAGER